MTIGATAITGQRRDRTGSRKRLESGTEVSFEISIGVGAPVYPIHRPQSACHEACSERRRDPKRIMLRSQHLSAKPRDRLVERLPGVWKVSAMVYRIFSDCWGGDPFGSDPAGLLVQGRLRGARDRGPRTLSRPADLSSWR